MGLGLRLESLDFVFLFLDDIFEVVAFLFNEFEPLFVLTTNRLVLVNPVIVKFLKFGFEFCFLGGKFHFQVIHFT